MKHTSNEKSIMNWTLKGGKPGNAASSKYQFLSWHNWQDKTQVAV